LKHPSSAQNSHLEPTKASPHEERRAPPRALTHPRCLSKPSTPATEGAGTTVIEAAPRRT
jgi:hypothetical protein